MSARSFNPKAAYHKVGDYSEKRWGIAVIMLIIGIGTYFFNTLFPDMWGMVVTIAVLVGLGWGIHFWKLHKTKRQERQANA